MAWVMMEKYTPLIRERKAKKPNTRAKTPGTRTAMSMANQKCSKPCQYQGSSFQSRKTMKSVSSLR